MRVYYLYIEGGFLKWFRIENRVPDSFLCEHFINEYNASIDRMKLCAVLDQSLKCIDGKNCTFSLPVICETNCTKAAYMKTRLCLEMGIKLNYLISLFNLIFYRKRKRTKKFNDFSNNDDNNNNNNNDNNNN
jgi:hypothetical protein